MRLHGGAGIFLALGSIIKDEAVGVVALFFRGVEFVVPLVGIDGDDDIPRAGVGLFALVTQLEIVENGSLRK